MSNLLDWLIEHEPSFRKTRLPSLYSDLIQQRAANPDGFAANAVAWQSALTQAALAGQLPSDNHLVLQSSDELLNALASPQYGRPSGLGAVLDEATKKMKMMNIKDFKSTETSVYDRSWVPHPLTILRWGLRQTGILGDSSYDVSGRLRNAQLVLIDALEAVSKQVSSLQANRGSSLTDRLMTREEFANNLTKVGSNSLSPTDVDVLLQYLSRDKHALSYDSQTVKFKSPSETLPEPITSEDTTIANMKTLLSGLEKQIATLDTKITSLQTEAQRCVKAGNKQLALSTLRSKKLAEKSLQQRTDTLHQVEEVYAKIEQAVDQVQVVAAMQSSAGVLKSLNKQVGGVERVEDVVEELREQMGQVDEVGQVLQEPVDNKMMLDEVEIDNELEAMEKEEQRVKQEKEAQATRVRLEELERIEAEKRAASNTAESARQQNTGEVDADLKDSIEKLDKLQLKEGEQKVNRRVVEDVKMSEAAS